MNEINKEVKKSFLTRTITAIVLVCIGIPTIILGNWPFMVVLCILALSAIYEIMKAKPHDKYPVLFKIFVYLITISFIYWTFFKGNSDIAQYVDGKFQMKDLSISTLGVTTMICVMFLFSISFKSVTVNDVVYLSTMCLFIGAAFQSLYFIRFCPEYLVDYTYSNQFASCLLLFYVLIGALISDLGAYIVGVLFGKHKMNPRISPKKTWEGFVGGLVLSAITTIVFAIVCDKLGNPVLYGIIDCEHWYFIVIVSLSMALVSVLGDLMFSCIKRCYGVKDFGKIFPGHGGVLDRFDSVLVTSLVTAIILLTIKNFPFFAR